MPVHLYEDNAGQLYLWNEGEDHYWTGLQNVFVGSAFAHDAEALLLGDTADWTGDLAQVPYTEGAFEGLTHIATYVSGTIVRIRPAGTAGQEYISG